MDISVIIPVFNEEKHLAACLDSLASQSLKPREIILVDDGSTDKSLSIAKKYSVRILKQRHQGPGAARNKAARQAKGAILVFVDADMVFDPQYLKNLIKPILKSAAKGTYHGQEFVANFDNRWARCWNINSNNPGASRFRPDSPEDTRDFRAVLKSEFLKVNGFNLTGYTDSQTLQKKLGYLPVAAPNAVALHHNPDTLSEVFRHASWVGKRPTRFGILGKFANLLRYSLPISKAIGLYKAFKYRNLSFFVFKIIYDLGFSFGIIKSLAGRSLAK